MYISRFFYPAINFSFYLSAFLRVRLRVCLSVCMCDSVHQSGCLSIRQSVCYSIFFLSTCLSASLFTCVSILLYVNRLIGQFNNFTGFPIAEYSLGPFTLISDFALSVMLNENHIDLFRSFKPLEMNKYNTINKNRNGITHLYFNIHS